MRNVCYLTEVWIISNGWKWDEVEAILQTGFFRDEISIGCNAQIRWYWIREGELVKQIS